MRYLAPACQANWRAIEAMFQMLGEYQGKCPLMKVVRAGGKLQPFSLASE